MDANFETNVKLLYGLLSNYQESERPHMYQKLIQLLSNIPTQLVEYESNYQEKAMRRQLLSDKKDTFISSFLHNNKYFSHCRNDMFRYFRYDGEHYTVDTEDNIIHTVVSQISSEKGALCSWKQKTRMGVLKQIKDTALFSSVNVPYSNTIQYVIALLSPTFFYSKSATKYFLTVLGDNLLRKTDNTIHLVPLCCRGLLKEISLACQLYFGNGQAIHSCKYKYNELHEFTNCRIIHINDCIETHYRLLIPHILDILCVGVHYSHRYTSSDMYLQSSCQDTTLINSVFYLKNKNKDELVENFINSYITIPNTSIDDTKKNMCEITWKNMYYLWRLFLNESGLPTIIFQEELRTLLIKSIIGKYYYDILPDTAETVDTFIGLTSKRLPIMELFTSFWNDTIVSVTIDIDTDNKLHHQLEVEEIITLFTQWTKMNKYSNKCITVYDIGLFIELNYPNIVIRSGKYIDNVYSTLWNVEKDVLQSVDIHDTSCSIDTQYVNYCKYNASHGIVNIMSKMYFEHVYCYLLSVSTN